MRYATMGRARAPSGGVTKQAMGSGCVFLQSEPSDSLGQIAAKTRSACHRRSMPCLLLRLTGLLPSLILRLRLLLDLLKCCIASGHFAPLWSIGNAIGDIHQ